MFILEPLQRALYFLIEMFFHIHLVTYYHLNPNIKKLMVLLCYNSQL